MRIFLQHMAVLLVCWVLSYFLVAFPHMTPLDVWETRGVRDSGSIVFAFTFVAFSIFSFIAFLVRSFKRPNND
jgi:hypothetical protein